MRHRLHYQNHMLKVIRNRHLDGNRECIEVQFQSIFAQLGELIDSCAESFRITE